MTDEGRRGGMKRTASQTGDEQKHQGIHPGSTTQNQGGKDSIGHKKGHDRIVPKADEAR